MPIRDTENRDRKLLRFLFANGVSIATLLSVVFAAGQFWSERESDRKLISGIVSKIDKVENELMLTRLKIAGYDVDLEHIKRRDLEHFSRDYNARPIPPNSNTR